MKHMRIIEDLGFEPKINEDQEQDVLEEKEEGNIDDKKGRKDQE